jgi:hypothetical protein
MAFKIGSKRTANFQATTGLVIVSSRLDIPLARRSNEFQENGCVGNLLKSQRGAIMQKPLMIVIAAGFLIAGISAFFHRPGPCASIMDQTTQKLNFSVDVIKAKGALVIGGEKVQDVSEGARKVGEHLTACCIAQHGDPPLPPDQYLACINGAKDYEAKIIQITNTIKEAETAKQQGNTQLAEQKVEEAKAIVVASTNIERDLGKLAAAAVVATGKPYFFFDFKGKTLGDKWEIIRPDAANYALEKDGLLIINAKTGGLANDDIPNLFRLKTAMPEGDWTATVKFSSEFPLKNEVFFLALLQDKEHWTGAILDTHGDLGWRWDQTLAVSLRRKAAAEELVSQGSLFFSGGPVAWNTFISENKLSQPIYLRLRRAGHDFIASSRLESSEPDAWVTLNKIAELQASSNLVIGFAQYSQGTGQTQVKVEWVKIETP